MGDPVTTAAAIGAGGSILGGMMAGDAASEAARISANAQLQAGQQAAEAAKFRPVGAIYTAVVSTNPGTLLGFGTWTAFGAGRVMVGYDSGNSLFDTAEETGGSADAITVSHTHTATTSITDPGHTHTYPIAGLSGTGANLPVRGVTQYETGTTNSQTTGISASTTVSSIGSSGTNANYQPYITVYMWKRTA